MPHPPPPVPPAVAAAAGALASPVPMRRGSVSERFVTCSKPGCRCADDPDARHGPYASLTRTVAGKTRSRWLTPEQATVATEQVKAGHEFRKRIEEFWEAGERWADAQLEPVRATSEEGLEKGGSKTNSRRRSKPKSPR